MMKRILVPADFSGTSENALFYAVEMAKRENAALMLLHVYSDDAGTDFMQAETSAINRLKSLTLKIEHAAKIPHEFFCREGSVVNNILAVAKEKNADLIIMGTRGESDIAKMILGSNAAKVMAGAECPVIAVPEGASYEPIRKITYATNYLSSDIQAIEKLVEIAAPFNAQLNILHIAHENEPAEEERKQMLNFMSEVNKKIDYNNLSFQMMSADNTESEMKDYLESGAADLFVMSTHHRNLFDKLFGHSATENMLYNSQVPLMAFHYNNRSSVKLFSAMP